MTGEPRSLLAAELPWGASVGAAAKAALQELRGPESAPTLRTGFVDLDYLCGGMPPASLWVIAGRSGSGKSMLGRDLVRHAIAQDRGSLHLSRRDRAEDVALGLLAAQGRVPLHGLGARAVSDEEWVRLQGASDRLRGAPLVIAEACRIDLGALRGRVDDFNRNSPAPCELVVIDDLPSGASQMSEVAVLRELAASREVAVAVVVQEDLDDPQIQMLRLEQLADVALRIHREDQVDRESPRAGEADLVISRHRRGPTAIITIAFHGHYGKFADLGPRVAL